MKRKINLARFLREEKVKKVDWVIFTIEPFAELAEESTDLELGEFFRSFIGDLIRQDGKGTDLAEALLDESRRYIAGKSKGGKASGEARARQAEERRERAENEQCSNSVEQCSNKNEQCSNSGANYNNTVQYSNSNSNSNSNKSKTKHNIVADAHSLKFPFSDFWDRYPNKKGRAAAEKTWQRMNNEDRRLAIDALPAYERSVSPQFLKHGSTYLNQKVWLDDLAPTNSLQTNGASNGKSFKQIDEERTRANVEYTINRLQQESAQLPTTDELVERYRQR